jgi:hypothetical protein
MSIAANGNSDRGHRVCDHGRSSTIALAHLDGPFVITISTNKEWRCPHDPADPCDAYEAEESPPGESRCCDEKTPCVEAGVTSTVYITDTRTGAQAKFGWFHRRPLPTIKISDEEIQVIADDCQQVAQLPLVRFEEKR